MSGRRKLRTQAERRELAATWALLHRAGVMTNERLGAEMSYDEIAMHMGVSRQRVQQLERAALNKIRHGMRWFTREWRMKE